MSHFTQLNLQGSSSKKPSSNTGTRPELSSKNQYGEAKIAAIISSLFAVTMITIFTLGTNACTKKDKPAITTLVSTPHAAVAPAPAITPAPAPVAAPKPAKKSPRQHKLVTYKNSDYGVSFRYPQRYTLKEGEEANLEWAGFGPVELNFVQPGGSTLSAIQLPDHMYAGTDFTSAFINVSVNPKMTAAECEQFAFPAQVPSDDAPMGPAKVKLGSTDFMEMDDAIGEEGKQADAKYYHVFQNNVCYEFTLGLTTLTTSGMKPVNRDSVFGKLEWILSTVKIKDVVTPEAATAASYTTGETVVQTQY